MNIYIDIHGCISTCVELAVADPTVWPPCLPPHRVEDHGDTGDAGITSSEHKGARTWML
jgi:hypothetical protein